MKRLLKWLFRIIALFVIAVILLLIFKDTILRKIAEHEIRAQTGMDVKIGRFSSGLLSPVVTIENLKLYNTPEFGGTEFLIIPELHLELDPDALREQKLRIKLARFNMSELDIVKNQAGETNIVTMLAKMPKGKLAPHGIEVGGGRKLDFEGIDVLNLSLGRLRYIDLKNRANDYNIPLGIDNQVFNNIRTEGDVYGMLIILWLHGGGASLMNPRDIANDFLGRKPKHIHIRTNQPAGPPQKTNSAPR